MSDSVTIPHHRVPARPGQSDDAVLQFAAEKLADRLLRLLDEWSSEFNGCDRDDMVRDLKSALRYESMDAYRLAKYLDERFGWDINESLVEAFGGWHVYDAHRHFEREWVRCYGVAPKLAVGAAVTYRGDAATIARIDADAGHYIVNVPAKGHASGGGYVVAFEAIEAQ